MHRRLFLGSGLAFAASPALAQPASAVGGFSAYAARLRTGLERAGGGRFLPPAEAELYAAHQSARAQAGLQGLARDAGLAAAARAQACDLLARNYFDHRSPEGFAPAERVGLFARSFVGLPGENIVEAEGSFPNVSSDLLMRCWMESPGHRENILRPAFTHVGLGVVQSGPRMIAAAAFGQQYARLDADLPLRPAPAEIAPRLLTAFPAIESFDLSPVGGGDLIGPYGPGGRGPSLPPGAYTLRPRFRRSGIEFTIVLGPIVEL